MYICISILHHIHVATFLVKSDFVINDGTLDPRSVECVFPSPLGLFQIRCSPRRPEVSVGEYLVVETDIFESFSWSDSNIAWLLSKFSVSCICLRWYDCTTPRTITRMVRTSQNYVTKWDDGPYNRVAEKPQSR